MNANGSATDRRHILTVNLEDYFQAEPLSSVISKKNWDRLERRVEQNTLATLDLLDKYDAKATFFTVGWLADHAGDIVAEVSRRGHEVASKGYFHRGIAQMSPEEFREDAVRSRLALERACGREVRGYRIARGCLSKKDLWALDVLAEEGFLLQFELSIDRPPQQPPAAGTGGPLPSHQCRRHLGAADLVLVDVWPQPADLRRKLHAATAPCPDPQETGGLASVGGWPADPLLSCLGTGPGTTTHNGGALAGTGAPIPQPRKNARSGRILSFALSRCGRFRISWPAGAAGDSRTSRRRRRVARDPSFGHPRGDYRSRSLLQ